MSGTNIGAFDVLWFQETEFDAVDLGEYLCCVLIRLIVIK